MEGVSKRTIVRLFMCSGYAGAIWGSFVALRELETRYNGIPIACTLTGIQDRGQGVKSPVWTFQSAGEQRTFESRHQSYTLPPLGSVRTLYLCKHDSQPRDTLQSLGQLPYNPWIYFLSSGIILYRGRQLSRLTYPFGGLKKRV